MCLAAWAGLVWATPLIPALRVEGQDEPAGASGAQTVAAVPGKRSQGRPGLRDRLYELLEHDHLPYSVGSRFVRLIVAIIVVDVLTMIFASVQEFDAKYGSLFTAIEIAAVCAFALEYFARLWTIVGHSIRDLSPLQARLGYVFSSLGIIDLLSFLPSAIALLMGDRITLVLTGMLPFLKLVRYSPALRSLLWAIYAERRALFGCVVILTGVVLLFACVLFAIEHNVQPEKFGNIPQAMWWAIVTLGTVGYGDVVPVTIPGKMVTSIAVILGFAMIALPVAIISSAFAEEVRRRDFVVTWGMLARVPLFSHLGAAEIADIMRLLRAQTIEAGEVLVRRGEVASSMYFITTGEVEIDLPKQRVRLTDGTFFGEIALLRRTNRSGTVTATRKTRLLALDAQDFHALIARLPTLAAHVRETAEARLADTAEAAQRGDIAPAELAMAETAQQAEPMVDR